MRFAFQDARTKREGGENGREVGDTRVFHATVRRIVES